MNGCTLKKASTHVNHHKYANESVSFQPIPMSLEINNLAIGPNLCGCALKKASTHRGRN